MSSPTVKCVIWDLDGTVWDDVAVELPDGREPEPRDDVLRAMRELSAHGVVNSLASRTAPEILDVVERHKDLSELIVAPQVGWQDKSQSIRRICGTLGISPSSVLLVDDSPFERAEVAHALPEVRSLDRPALLASLGDLLPSRLTAEAVSRTQLYRDEARRQAEAGRFTNREEFLAGCRMRLHVGPVEDAQVDRVVELARRSHRLSSTALMVDDDDVRQWSRRQDRDVLVGQLSDRFGDYGLIALALVDRSVGCSIELFAVSCRVAGRGVAEAFLLEVIGRSAAAAETDTVTMPILMTRANVELRVLVRRLGLDVEVAGDGILRCTARRSQMPEAPPWLRPTTGALPLTQGEVQDPLDALVADVLGMTSAEVQALPDETPLFGPPLELGSLSGADLLSRILEVYGIDIAAEDLALDALASLGHLRDYVRRRKAR